MSVSPSGGILARILSHEQRRDRASVGDDRPLLLCFRGVARLLGTWADEPTVTVTRLSRGVGVGFVESGRTVQLSERRPRRGLTARRDRGTS